MAFLKNTYGVLVFTVSVVIDQLTSTIKTLVEYHLIRDKLTLRNITQVDAEQIQALKSLVQVSTVTGTNRIVPYRFRSYDDYL